MEKPLIEISPHNASDEDIQKLLDYLDKNNWDYCRDYPRMN